MKRNTVQIFFVCAVFFSAVRYNIRIIGRREIVDLEQMF